MSDKMITPEEYLIENPTALIFRHEISKAGQSTAMTRPGNGEGWKYSEADILIDWTGYTEPHVMIGPDFPQSRKREVKWDKWRITQDKVNKGDVPFQRVELPDGGTCFRIGKYIDEPSQELNSEPYQNPIAGKGSELSRFLPDGWEWKQAAREGNWLTGPARYSFFTCKELWHGHGLLHPSEGGGFQKHTPGDPMPCDGKLRVDVIDAIGHIDCGDEADAWIWDYLDCQGDIVGWRPHFKEKN
jgi:hypothetical protein